VRGEYEHPARCTASGRPTELAAGPLAPTQDPSGAGASFREIPRRGTERPSVRLYVCTSVRPPPPGRGRDPPLLLRLRRTAPLARPVIMERRSSWSAGHHGRIGTRRGGDATRRGRTTGLLRHAASAPRVFRDAAACREPEEAKLRRSSGWDAAAASWRVVICRSAPSVSCSRHRRSTPRVISSASPPGELRRSWDVAAVRRVYSETQQVSSSSPQRALSGSRRTVPLSSSANSASSVDLNSSITRYL